MKPKIILLLLASVFFPMLSVNVISQEYGCTTFSLIENDRHIFGRSLDTKAEFGYVLINKRDMRKVSYLDSGSNESPATWISKYGSITFNQISCDIPHGGMNEMGLVVEHMFYGDSKYPPVDGRPAINSLQWIQYVLDNCQSVSDVINIDTLLRISKTEYKFPVHFHMMDRTGDRAIIEFLDDTIYVYRGAGYTACALSNSSYNYSLNYLSGFTGWGGTNPIPVDVTGSTDRFVKAADMAKNYTGSGTIPIITYGFSILDSVWENTKWELIYDLDSLCIHYRILSDSSIRSIYLSNFDFDCLSGTKMLEIGNDPDISSDWLDYSTELNSNLIKTTCNMNDLLNNLIADEKDQIAVYPEITSFCTTTSIKDYYLEEPNLFPNPANDFINLIMTEQIPSEFTLLNILGEQVQAGEIDQNDFKLDISNLAKGLYILRLDGRSYKIIKN